MPSEASSRPKCVYIPSPSPAIEHARAASAIDRADNPILARAPQIEAELLRRHQAAYPEAADSASAASLYTKRSAARPAADGLVDQVPLDFFGRPLTVVGLPSDAADGKGAKDGGETDREREAKRFRVFYKFHEGSSTAVRKPLRMSALF